MNALAQKKEKTALVQSGLNESLSTLQSLMNDANENPNKLVELQAYLGKNPDLRDRISVLASTAKEHLLEKVIAESGSRLLVREEMEGMRNKLTYKDSTPLEMLLIDSVLMCWLRLQYAECHMNYSMGGEQSFAQVDFADKMLTRAQNRYNRAIESLARVRRLSRPKNKKSIDISVKTTNVIKAKSKSR